MVIKEIVQRFEYYGIIAIKNRVNGKCGNFMKKNVYAVVIMIGYSFDQSRFAAIYFFPRNTLERATVLIASIHLALAFVLLGSLTHTQKTWTERNIKNIYKRRSNF